jgi:hypothetical protein
MIMIRKGKQNTNNLIFRMINGWYVEWHEQYIIYFTNNVEIYPRLSSKVLWIIIAKHLSTLLIGWSDFEYGWLLPL